MKFTLKTPCGLCPFRNDDGRLYVDEDRLREFATSDLFVCHQTAAYDEPDGDDDPPRGYVQKSDGSSQHCAGAMIFLEHTGRINTAMQLAERFGLYDRDGLDLTAPVFRSWDEVRAASIGFGRFGPAKKK